MVAGAGGVSDHTVILASETDLLLGITHTGSTVSMWRTDGTVAGTQLIQEDMGDNGKINSSQIVRDFGSNLIFVDWTPALGSELYRTTETGTPVLINDLNPGSGSGFEQKLGLIGEKILFRGNDGLTGFEPWVYDLDVEALEPNVAQRCEFQANTYTLGMQAYPSTAMHESGNYVVVWWSEGQDGSERGVFGQRYYANGAPQGPEFQVNAATESRQDVPIVAMDAEGDFVVVWESWFQDGSYFGIYGQRYNQYGQPQGGAFRVNQTTLNSQFLGSVATDALGNFVVTWSSEGQDGDQNGVFARMYDDQGIALGDEFPVNSNTTGDQEVSAIAMNASGAFVITWQSDGQDGSGLGIYAQRYDQNGIAQGGEFLVNSNTTGDQTWPTVSMQDNGSFVIAWQGLGLNQDGSGAGIFAQRFQQDGTPLGGEFQVNTFTSQAQLEPSIGMAADGRFAICWHGSGNQDGDGFGIFGQEYDAYGLRIGDEFQVNTFTAGDQVFPEIAMNSIGEYVIVWHSEVQDGSSWGIFGQRYGTNPDNPCTGNMDPDFTLVDAQADTLIGPIANGDVLDLTYLPTNRLNIIAHFDDESLPLTKVVFDFNQGTIALNDWHVPYSMAGDNQAGNFYYYSFTPGAYSLSAEAYTNSANGGGVINTKTLHFTVIRSPQLVTGLSLVDALNNVILGPLHEGDVIDLATIGHNRLNVIAHTAPNDIGSVDFDLRGDAVYDRYDNQPPYCMPGDNQAGGYYQYRFNPGSYTLTATPYTVYAAGGDAGSPLTIGFTVVNTGARLGLSTETLTAFPNPTTGKLNLQFLNVPGGKAQLYILNLQGQTLEMRTLDVVPGSSTQALQVHDLASGMYVLYCRMGEMRYSTRIIKQ